MADVDLVEPSGLNWGPNAALRNISVWLPC